MDNIVIAPATIQDKDALADLFYAHLSENVEYISHGEMQMGIGHLVFNGEEYVPQLDADSRHLWLTYIEEHMTTAARLSASSVIFLSMLLRVAGVSEAVCLPQPKIGSVIEVLRTFISNPARIITMPMSFLCAADS